MKINFNYCHYQSLNKTNTTSYKKVNNQTSAKKDIYFKEDHSWRTLGYEISPNGKYLRDLIRAELELNATLRDNELQTKPIAPSIKPQLSIDSKYYMLGLPVKYKDGKIMNICTNLKDTPDFNGLRGKTPLSGKKQAVNWRVKAIKKAGIKSVIDLRTTGECSKAALEALNNNGLTYINFPVEDMSWEAKSLNSITSFINTVNQGDYYVGCANGEARTDLAIAINYLLNPKAKNYPRFYFAKANTRGVVIKNNIRQILNLITENPQIVKDWGYNSYEDFKEKFSKKIKIMTKDLKSEQ